jgi:pyrroline-5-carboxylate reductase
MPKLAFIGAGRMASAMVKGLIRSQACQPQDITVISGADSTASDLARATGVRVAASPEELCAQADAVVLACKPQQFLQLDQRYTALTQGKCVLSILAGTQLGSLTKFFSSARNVARAMPNTPGAVGQGITALCSASPLDQADQSIIRAILSGLGEIVELPESSFDAVTAVSGSGPGFFFEFVAAYEAAAVSLGFTPAQAQRLVRQTLAGSLSLLQSGSESPDELRNQVTSPGGTTKAGLDVMASQQFRQLILNTLEAAKNRSAELGKGK